MVQGIAISLLALFLVFTLFPISTSFSQKVDTPSSLGIVLTSTAPFNFKDADGSTLVLGEVSNTKSFPVSGVKVWVGFYDNNSDKPIETTIGTTILEVIPPFGKSPYMIKSPSANSKITSVSVNLLGFSSSPEKNPLLNFDLDTLSIGEKLLLSGKITNNGASSSINTKIHLISYDSFNPPRVLGIETIILNNNIITGGTENFEFNLKHDTRAVDFKIVGESKDYSTGLLDISSLPQVPTPTSLVEDTTPIIQKPVEIEIPSWIKNVAAFWCENKIDDTAFIGGIQYLIENNIIVVSVTSSGDGSSQSIPTWVKNNSCWWSQGQIADTDFASGLEYLISEGILRV